MTFWALYLGTGSGQQPMGLLVDEVICQFILGAFAAIGVAGECLAWVPGVSS